MVQFQVDCLTSEQEAFARNYGNSVGKLWVKARGIENDMFNKHKDFFSNLLPKPTTQGKHVSKSKIRNPTGPRIPLTQAKRSQMQARTHTRVENVLEICKEEKIGVMDYLAIMGRSIFLNPNGENFDKTKGQFFQSYLKGTLKVEGLGTL